MHEMADVGEKEFRAIEEELQGLTGKFAHAFGHEYPYVRFYPCGRECRGCPHPSLGHVPQREDWVQNPAHPDEVAALRKRFYYLSRRRGKLLHLLQTMHMSVYRLGGASHRVNPPKAAQADFLELEE